MFLTSCVGTVKDANSKAGNILSSGSTSAAITFSGLTQANPISNSKVELFFYPATGDQNAITYEIYINGSPTPTQVSGKSLTANSKGLMMVVISHLTINTTYTFNMKAVITGTTSSALLDPTKALTAKTFANETADFQGISTVALGAGQSGKNTVIVTWLSATTLGTEISPRPNDPVAYEIKYISQLGGVLNLNNAKYSGPDRVTVQNPTPLSSSPALSTQTSATINGLNPGTTYFFQVRAIHTNYAIYGSDPNYKTEANTKYLTIKTLSTTDDAFTFSTNLVTLSHPLADAGLSKLNLAWLPAGGPFDHYSVCYTKLADPNDLTDHLQDTADFDFGVNNCQSKAANDTFQQISGLLSYAYYQVKVIACKNIACDFGNRIFSDLKSARVFTNVAPFGGIMTYDSPQDETSLNTIKVNFNPPVLSAGYINEFRMYCYSDANDHTGVRIDNLAKPTSGTGKTNCNGLTILTAFPNVPADFSTFSQIQIDLPAGGIDGIKQYCFSLVPTINDPSLVQSDVANAIVKCFTPQMKTPNILQFGGRDIACPAIGNAVHLTWPSPTGGLYSKYITFYQRKITGSEFFDFQAAIAEYTSGVSNHYQWIDPIDKTLNFLDLTGLLPGAKYNVGVIPYLNYGGSKLWAQYNYNVGECSLPLPTFKFQEWMQVFAIGPKEDGLTPPTLDANNNILRSYIPETINADDQPIEIATTVTSGTPIPTDATKLGTVNFDGIYGKYNAIDTNPTYQYSNTGIVKLMWQDISLYGGTDYLRNYYALDNGLAKSLRKYGYKVFRSDDNKMSWIDLTTKSSVNTYQSTTNSGLIQAVPYTWKPRNNATDLSAYAASFTDYSVKFSGTSGDTDRARVYYYKIVAVFNGSQLLNEDTSNPNHNIIKVVLPPRNMALVNRMMANRTICQEMNLPLLKGSGQYYACNYDGVGSKGLAPPYAVGSTVYDSGGDLLMDRFELGIPFTRGDSLATTASTSYFTGTKLTFAGAADNGSKFTGCFNDSSTYYEPNQGVGLSTGNYSYSHLIPGDCMGTDFSLSINNLASPCSDPTLVAKNGYTYPGSSDANNTEVNDCTNPNYVGQTLLNLANTNSLLFTENRFAPTQSEFAAVYYIRSNGGGYQLFNFPAGNSKFLQADISYSGPPSYINLSYLDSTNNLRARWLPTNRLFGNFSLGAAGSGFATAGNTVINLYDKSIAQIKSLLYDNSTVISPPDSQISSARYYTDTTPLARIFTSNAAKLPPATGFSMPQAQKICSTYKVQVGTETATTAYHSSIGTIDLTKRLMRKKEQTVAAAWPVTWNNSKVTTIEKGYDIDDTTMTTGCTGFEKSNINPNATFSLQKDSVLDLFIPLHISTTPPTLTGSSGINSSEACVSRFGIQDLAGNLREYISDQIFCDYLPQNTNAKSTIMIGTPDHPELSVPFTGGYLDLRNMTGWVNSLPTSGNCSVVEPGGVILDSSGSRSGHYTNGGVFNSIYLPDSTTLNTSVVSMTKSIDQASVLTNRNGDGSFLDFGSANLGPSLKEDHVFDLPSMYFNVPLGMPLTCTSGCDNSTGGSGNKLVATSYHAGLTGSSYNPTTTPIRDFPINNSTFSSSNIETIAVGFATTTSNANLHLPFQYPSGVNVNADPALNSFDYTTITTLDAAPGIPLYNYSWLVDRATPLSFTVGGSSSSEPGRYTFKMDGVAEVNNRATTDQGTRCVIMLDE